MICEKTEWICENYRETDGERKDTRGKASKRQRQAAEPLPCCLPNINSGRGLTVSFGLENKAHRSFKEEEKIHGPYKVAFPKSSPQQNKYKTCEETEKSNLLSREKVISSSQWKFLSRGKRHPLYILEGPPPPRPHHPGSQWPKVHWQRTGLGEDSESSCEQNLLRALKEGNESKDEGPADLWVLWLFEDHKTIGLEKKILDSVLSTLLIICGESRDSGRLRDFPKNSQLFQRQTRIRTQTQ